ncbi:TetR/AcrR family transcriptional regulator [Roseovarius sp.]|jgi:AcrR family transcriptional regulator|uniref:TetR/AcrR family transcriptional regulator n=1 Tax=Roseovarius sp. TaxID=1486281 RepID=UPI0026155F19|nr:TetR/AcrR family transcriptional regulator [Roseovarius sp.]MDM8167711.1 TetR/AcrR family transcriptional regulator [Roseovarius sp.]
MSNSQKKRRRSQAERREQTQSAILEAAVEILSLEGYANFSSSGVAARAGISRGALEHYYPKRINLIAAACQYSMEAAIEETRSYVKNAEVTQDLIGNFIAASERFFFAQGYIAQVELLIAARADPQLGEVIFPIIKDARRTLDGIWAETIAGWGHDREKAERFVEVSHYLLRGMFFVNTWLPYDLDKDAVLQDWRDLAPTVLAHRPHAEGEDQTSPSPARKATAR